MKWGERALEEADFLDYCCFIRSISNSNFSFVVVII